MAFSVLLPFIIGDWRIARQMLITLDWHQREPFKHRKAQAKKRRTHIAQRSRAHQSVSKDRNLTNMHTIWFLILKPKSKISSSNPSSKNHRPVHLIIIEWRNSMNFGSSIYKIKWNSSNQAVFAFNHNSRQPAIRDQYWITITFEISLFYSYS